MRPFHLFQAEFFNFNDVLLSLHKHHFRHISESIPEAMLNRLDLNNTKVRNHITNKTLKRATNSSSPVKRATLLRVASKLIVDSRTEEGKVWNGLKDDFSFEIFVRRLQRMWRQRRALRKRRASIFSLQICVRRLQRGWRQRRDFRARGARIAGGETNGCPAAALSAAAEEEKVQDGLEKGRDAKDQIRSLGSGSRFGCGTPAPAPPLGTYDGIDHLPVQIRPASSLSLVGAGLGIELSKLSSSKRIH